MLMSIFATVSSVLSFVTIALALRRRRFNEGQDDA